MFRLRRKKKAKAFDEKQLGGIIKGELADYIKREELQGYLENIDKDKRKKELWNSLPAYKKIKVLRYALEKKGGQHGKKKAL